MSDERTLRTTAQVPTGIVPVVPAALDVARLRGQLVEQAGLLAGLDALRDADETSVPPSQALPPLVEALMTRRAAAGEVERERIDRLLAYCARRLGEGNSFGDGLWPRVAESLVVLTHGARALASDPGLDAALRTARATVSSSERDSMIRKTAALFAEAGLDPPPIADDEATRRHVRRGNAVPLVGGALMFGGYFPLYALFGEWVASIAIFAGLGAGWLLQRSVRDCPACGARLPRKPLFQGPKSCVGCGHLLRP